MAKSSMSAAILFLSLGIWGCTDAVVEETARRRQAAEQRIHDSLAALRDLPPSASIDQILGACSAVAALQTVPSELRDRCGNAFGEQAKARFQSGNFAAAAGSASQARAHGNISPDVDRVLHESSLQVALVSFEQKLGEATDKQTSDPAAALKAIEIAESVCARGNDLGIPEKTLNSMQKRLAPVAKRVRKAAETEKRQTAAAARQLYAQVLQNKYYDDSMNIRVRASGPDATVLTLTFVLFDEVWVHHFQKGDLLGEMERQGFKKVVLSDGYTKTWTWKF